MASNKVLKILHVFESYLPGSQNWAFRVISNMEETDVYVSALEYCNPEFMTTILHPISLPEYVSPDLISESSASGDSIFVKAINKFKRKNDFEKYISFLTDRIQELQVDIIHCHFANVAWNFLKLKKITNLPFVVSFYGFDYESLSYTFPVWERRYQELFKTADLFICEGSFGASILKSQGCPEEKIKVNHLGVETAKIPFIDRNKKENELHLVQVCNFFQKKGQVYSLEAFSEALKTCPNMTLTFVGSDSEGIREKLKKNVEENNLSGKISFIEFIDFSKLYDFLGKYEVFIHPSCYADNRDCEGGAPVVILDAEATGMPVIATLHCDIPEEVVHEKTGLLTSEKDTQALTDSIIRFYKMSNDEYNWFSKNARVHVEKKFNAKKNSMNLKKIYLEYFQNSLNKITKNSNGSNLSTLVPVLINVFLFPFMETL